MFGKIFTQTPKKETLERARIQAATEDLLRDRSEKSRALDAAIERAMRMHISEKVNT